MDESTDSTKRGLRLRGVQGQVVSRGGLRAGSGGVDEGPLPGDIERFSGVTRTCPECGKEVFDDVTRCYHCDADMDTPGTRRSGGKPVWVVITAAVGIVVLLLVLVRGWL
ncbi:MAG: hypothetical protein ACK5TP_07615 [bacterium]